MRLHLPKARLVSFISRRNFNVVVCFLYYVREHAVHGHLVLHVYWCARLAETVVVHDFAVVCPVSIVGQWANEVKSKLAANLNIYMYHGSKR